METSRDISPRRTLRTSTFVSGKGDSLMIWDPVQQAFTPQNSPRYIPDTTKVKTYGARSVVKGRAIEIIKAYTKAYVYAKIAFDNTRDVLSHLPESLVDIIGRKENLHAPGMPRRRNIWRRTTPCRQAPNSTKILPKLTFSSNSVYSLWSCHHLRISRKISLYWSTISTAAPEA